MILGTVFNIFRMRNYIHNVLKGHGLEEEEYQKLQEQRLKTLVKHAYENVYLYRNKYDEVGVKPEDIRSVEDIHKLPIITRDHLRRGFPKQILAQNINPKNCFVISTTGYTGAPVRIYRNRRLLKLAPLIFLITRPTIPKILEARAGEKINRRITIILPADEEYDIYLIIKQILKLPGFLRGFLQYINSADDPREHLRALQKHQPDIIATSPTVLKSIAIVAREEGIAIPQPKLLIVGGELMDENTRNAILKAFSGDIIEHYGAEEVGTIAVECSRHEGLHILSPAIVLEILQNGKPAPPGVPGDVVVTDLWNMASPIIRYSGLGDIATLSKKSCSCGSKLPLLEIIEGRNVDSFVLPDGRLVHPFSLTVALEHIPTIVRFQIIQEQIDRARILIVEEKTTPRPPRSPFAEGESLWSAIMDSYRKLLGEDMHIIIDLVDDIPRPPGLRFYPSVRSLVKKPSYLSQ